MTFAPIAQAPALTFVQRTAPAYILICRDPLGGADERSSRLGPPGVDLRPPGHLIQSRKRERLAMGVDLQGLQHPVANEQDQPAYFLAVWAADYSVHRHRVRCV